MSSQPGPVNPVESPPASVEPFVDPDTAAQYLHTPVATCWRWCAKG